jgi:hypothetical protein
VGRPTERFVDTAKVLDVDGALGFGVAARSKGLRRRPTTLDPAGLNGIVALEICNCDLGNLTLAETTAIGAVGGRFLAGANLEGFPGALGVVLFLRSLLAKWPFVCASRLIGSGAARFGFTARFEEDAFAARATALGAREECPFRAVERTREAALFLPALTVRNLPFFIATVSPTVGGSETEHYGRMQVFATEFPGSWNDSAGSGGRGWLVFSAIFDSSAPRHQAQPHSCLDLKSKSMFSAAARQRPSQELWRQGGRQIAVCLLNSLRSIL